jgi:uncharacterized protein YdeI (YjbR/CyaY-like superfamily)
MAAVKAAARAAANTGARAATSTSSVLPRDTVQPKDLAAWGRWLERNHERPNGVWLVTFKRTSGKARFSYAEAVEEALRFGWVDSIARTLDPERTMQWFAPRKKGSGWAATNHARVARLIAEGRMAPAGLAKVEAAKADGSWDRLVKAHAEGPPRDLVAAFRRHAGSAKHFAAFPLGVRKQILEWIATAKRVETRAARVEQTARLAAKNQRANQWVPPDKRRTR